jgi:hypothetical protein
MLEEGLGTSLRAGLITGLVAVLTADLTKTCHVKSLVTSFTKGISKSF